MEYKYKNIYGKENKITQNDLEEIFLIQYNDIFSKLMSKNIEELFSMLEKQVFFHLKIINKKYQNSLLSFFYDKYCSIIQKDKNRVQNIYNKLMAHPKGNLVQLNTLDVFIHCFKCKEILHKCGNKLIIYEDLIFCLKCKKVYNKNQIKLFCKECHKTYLTTKRTEEEKKYDYFYSVSFTNYHCYIENE